MPSAEERFRAKIERRGGHDVWTGAVDTRGVGLVRIDGKLRTVQRAAWEFAYGPLPPGARVNSCAAERACVRVDHLSLSNTTTATSSGATQRRPRGTGSLREARPGVWKVTITQGRTPEGRPVRRSMTIEGRRGDAERTLHELLAGVRRDLGDLRVRELVGRLLEERSRQGDRDDTDVRVLHDVLEPRLADTLATAFDAPDAERVLTDIYQEAGTVTTRRALELLREAYCWAIRQGWCDHNPLHDITVRTLR